MDCIPPGSPVYGMSQARILKRAAFFFSKEKNKSNYINIFKEDILIRKMDILFNLTSCSENKLFPNYDTDGYVFNIFCRELRSNLENEFFSYLHLKPI